MEHVFIGLIDIASQLRDWKYGFNAIGVKVTTASIYRVHVAQQNEVDIDIRKTWNPSYRGVRPRALQAYLQDKWSFGKNAVFRKALKECDTFIMIARGFYRDYEDFQIIRDKGKKLICFFVGDDARWYYPMQQEFVKFGMPPIQYEQSYNYSVQQLNEHLLHLRNAERYANVVFSSPNQAQLQLRPYFKSNIPLILSSFEANTRQREVPKIIHAPSNPNFKGTVYFMDAIERLRKENIPFEFELIQGLPYQEALARYRDCDIVLNQLFCPGGGKLAHEGMALGKVMLSFMGYEYGYDEHVPADCPIVDVDPVNIYERLKAIILDQPRRALLAEQGRAYVEKYNAAEKLASHMRNVLENPALSPEFKPDFFRNYFVPESPEAAVVYNQWNRYVANCDWYKKEVGSFSRDGLIF